MSFYDTYKKYEDFDLEGFFDSLKTADVQKALSAEIPTVKDFLALLAPPAASYLEEMAQKAHKLSLQYFGRAIQLYTPMYLANYCENQCTYCGFNVENAIERKKLSMREVEKEAEFIAREGLRHILILTGGSRKETPLEYMKDCVKIIKKYFDSISVEVYPLMAGEYNELIKEGVDGLTIYQEVYDKEVYDKVHLAGPKKNYRFRLDAPERAASQGMRCINVGALFGLDQWQKQAFFTGLHAKYLRDKFTSAEISVSVPRLTGHAGEFNDSYEVKDKDIVQIILALRIFLLRVGITLSTREAPALRENLIPLGVTKISAGSTTAVGGHTVTCTENDPSEQFEISDKRGVAEIKKLLKDLNYQPVLKDWIGGV